MKNLLNKIQTKMPHFFKKEKGATMVEYAIMVALIAIFCIVAVTQLGVGVNATFSNAAAALPLTGG